MAGASACAASAKVVGVVVVSSPAAAVAWAVDEEMANPPASRSSTTTWCGSCVRLGASCSGDEGGVARSGVSVVAVGAGVPMAARVVAATSPFENVKGLADTAVSSSSGIKEVMASILF